LDHPNILKLYEFYEDNNEYCIITDFWEGGDLYEYLETHQSIQEYEISEIMKQLFSILKYIHSKNIVHRDIKRYN
jgi:calcium-dependent protein kinase